MCALDVLDCDCDYGVWTSLLLFEFDGEIARRRTYVGGINRVPLFACLARYHDGIVMPRGTLTHQRGRDLHHHAPAFVCLCCKSP